MTPNRHFFLLLTVVFFGVCITSCGAMIQIIDVDVKLPAEHPVSFDADNITLFNTLYDTSEQDFPVWNDSLLINKVAEGFRSQLANDLSIDPDSISIFNHYCGDTSRGTLDDKEYIYSLSEQTGARTLVLIDSLKIGEFAHKQTMSAAGSEYRPVYIDAVWQMVFRIFDMESDAFTARFAFKDTLYWNIISRNIDNLAVERRIVNSLPETATYLGGLAAKITQPQWETQERVLFFYSGVKWFKAMEHAFSFEWESARDLWLSITQETKNPKKLAFAAFNLAVASEMMGHVDLAKEWLELARKYLNIPEVIHYQQMLDERKQQQNTLFSMGAKHVLPLQ